MQHRRMAWNYSSGGGVKGGRGSRTRSAAEGEHRTGEHPAQRTLDADGATMLCGRGGVGFATPPPATRRARGLGRSPKVRRPGPVILDQENRASLRSATTTKRSSRPYCGEQIGGPDPVTSRPFKWLVNLHAFTIILACLPYPACLV